MEYNPNHYYVVEVKVSKLNGYDTINEAIKSEWHNPKIVLGYVSSKTPAEVLKVLIDSINSSTIEGTLFLLHGSTFHGEPRILNKMEVEDW